MEDHHDAHVVARESKRAALEAKAMVGVAEALEGLNSDQVRRTLNASAALLDLDVRIPVPRA